MQPGDLENLAEKVAVAIREADGRYCDLHLHPRLANLPHEDIAAAVSILEKWGYELKKNARGHYLIRNAPDCFLAHEIRFNLNTRLLGRVIHSFHTVQSTNTTAHQLAVAGEPEGTIVIAEKQTRGKGRFGRSWHSPDKLGMYCSVILRPPIPPGLAPGISLITAVALADTIAALGKLEVGIKWPNDVFISGIKAAGILTELATELDLINFVIVGIGVNINHEESDFPPELRPIAISIRQALGRKINRVEFLRSFLRQLEAEYLGFKKHGLAGSREKILAYSILLGKRIELKIGRKIISGTVVDIDSEGRLVVETPDGLKPCSAGEITMHEG